VLCASIMLKADSELAAPELKQFLVEKIAGFKIPELLYFQYQQLPRIAAGKIAKKQLRQETIDNLASS